MSGCLLLLVPLCRATFKLEALGPLRLILVNKGYLKQVGTPTLPTAIPLKSSSSMRATLVFNLFF
jgi:hypothetical protein